MDKADLRLSPKSHRDYNLNKCTQEESTQNNKLECKSHRNHSIKELLNFLRSRNYTVDRDRRVREIEVTMLVLCDSI